MILLLMLLIFLVVVFSCLTCNSTGIRSLLGITALVCVFVLLIAISVLIIFIEFGFGGELISFIVLMAVCAAIIWNNRRRIDWKRVFKLEDDS